MSATSYVSTWTPEQREQWMDDALCAQTDPEAFFPEKGGSVREAKATCGKCPVREQCLAYALREHITDGIWGGTSPRERRAMDEPRPSSESAFDDDRLRDLHRQGLSAAQIAERLGCSPRHAGRRLGNLGLETDEMARRRAFREAKETDMPTPAEDPAPAAPYSVKYTKGEPGDRVPAFVSIDTEEHGRLGFWTLLEVPA